MFTRMYMNNSHGQWCENCQNASKSCLWRPTSRTGSRLVRSGWTTRDSFSSLQSTPLGGRLSGSSGLLDATVKAWKRRVTKCFYNQTRRRAVPLKAEPVCPGVLTDPSRWRQAGEVLIIVAIQRKTLSWKRPDTYFLIIPIIPHPFLVSSPSSPCYLCSGDILHRRPLLTVAPLPVRDWLVLQRHRRARRSVVLWVWRCCRQGRCHSDGTGAESWGVIA